jgi:hypothetical protein
MHSNAVRRLRRLGFGALLLRWLEGRVGAAGRFAAGFCGGGAAGQRAALAT